MDEIKQLLEAQARAFEEFKRANDTKLAEIEQKGFASAEALERFAKVETEMKRIDAASAELAGRIAAAQLAGVAGKSGEDPAAGERKAAFNRYLRKGEQGLNEAEVKAMRTASDPDGGYLVIPEVEAAIDRVAGTVSAMYRLGKTVTISTAKWEKMMKTAGMSMRRIGDGAAGGESTNPKYAKVSIEVHTAEVEPWVFNETLEDASTDLAADLAEEAGIAFAEGAGAEFITGDGVGKARGITAYSNVANASYAWGSIGYIASGAAGAFAGSNPSDKVVALQHALKSQYRSGAVWLCNDATLGTMRQMKDGSGAYYLWNPDPAGGFGGRFLGSVVEVDDNMPAIAANSYSLAYGNLARAYAVVQRAGTALIRDNITSKGQTKFNFRRRFGGGIYNYEALKLMKFATS